MKKTDAMVWCLGVLLCAITFNSCTPVEINSQEVSKPETTPALNNTRKKPSITYKLGPLVDLHHELNLQPDMMSAPCDITDFGKVLSGYFEVLVKDPLFDLELIAYYAELHQKYVTHYVGDNFYGAGGEYNMLAKKRMRELTRFWGLNREIRLNGQHTASLDDREILTDMIESFDRTVRNRDEAYAKTDLLLDINSRSPNIPENPYFALDAFTRPNGLLVIGDGLLQSLTDVGIEGDIAFSSILAHEWWHQAQYENETDWKRMDQFPDPALRNRFSELEADFAAAYFLSHKRGATYNWKRIERYFLLSFNVGDCLPDSSQHHGTPAERMSAARSGFELADAARKRGFILTPEQIHEKFQEVYEAFIL